MSPRLLYFSRDYTPHDNRFLSALAKTDYKVYFIQLERRGHSLEDRPLPPGVTQIHWQGGQKPVHLSDAPRLLRDLKRVIRAVQPDLIQAGPIQTAAFLVALSGFRPLVSTSWGYDLLLDATRNAAWGWATRYTLQHSAAMVGDCDTIRQKGITHGMRSDRIVAFPWGVDLQHFSPQPLEAHDPTIFTLLSTRGWEPIYGVETLARGFSLAAQEARHRGSGFPQLRLIMLGNGSLAGSLKQIFRQANVLEQVSFPGQISQAQLPCFYQAADLYVCASRSDGSSISLLEAMACGRPALVSDIPGNREWVTPESNGWWFSENEADVLAEFILKAACQRPRLADMGRVARQVVEQKADWTKNFPKLLDAYQIALSN